MIRRPEVFDEEYVPPDDLLHRHAEVRRLSDALRPLARDEPGRSALVFGPSGTGKTTTARFVLGRLQRETEVTTTYVNCWDHRSRRDVTVELLDAVGARTHDAHASTATDALVRRLRDAASSPLVVVLDELDQIRDADVLYDLHRMRDVTFVGIANDEDELLAYLDDRIRSRLSRTIRIEMESYTVDQLRSILDDRIRVALAPDVIGDAVVREVADAASGDARAAINYLHAAARRAESAGSERITADHLPNAITDARHARRSEVLERFGEHERALDEAIHEVGEGSARSEIYEAYADRVDDPRSKRTVRRKIKKVADYDPFVEAVGETKGRTYRSLL